MSLKTFREELQRLMPNEMARPFTCDGSPLECRIFVVGLNSATQLEYPFFARYWNDVYGFDRETFERDYQCVREKRSSTRRRGKSPTRQRIEYFVKGAFPVPCLETNESMQFRRKMSANLKSQIRKRILLNILSKQSGLLEFSSTPMSR